MLTKRSVTAITQYGRKHGFENRTQEVIHTIEDMLPSLGAQSKSRVMINRIGITLLQENVTVIAPSCPDYSHTRGKYDFTSVGAGVPLLSRLHIEFLEHIATLVPRMRCEIVVADQEVSDEALCKKIGHTKDGFLSLIHRSIAATSEYVAPKGWCVAAMTERFPELEALETVITKEIASDQSLQSRLKHDTLARSDMYRMIGVYDTEAMHRRTIRTAAQYCALAHIAARDKLLVCNHETVNLGWYNRYGAAVLHNPISVY